MRDALVFHNDAYRRPLSCFLSRRAGGLAVRPSPRRGRRHHAPGGPSLAHRSPAEKQAAKHACLAARSQETKKRRRGTLATCRAKPLFSARGAGGRGQPTHDGRLGADLVQEHAAVQLVDHARVGAHDAADVLHDGVGLRRGTARRSARAAWPSVPARSAGQSRGPAPLAAAAVAAAEAGRGQGSSVACKVGETAPVLTFDTSCTRM